MFTPVLVERAGVNILYRTGCPTGSGMHEDAKSGQLFMADRLFVVWWAHQDSNLGPAGYEPEALPTEL